MHFRDMASDLISGLIMGDFFPRLWRGSRRQEQIPCDDLYFQGDGKLIQAANRPFGPP